MGTFFTNTLSKQTKLPWFVPLYKPVESVAHQYATSNHGTDADHSLIASQVGQERHGAHDEEQCTTSVSSESGSDTTWEEHREYMKQWHLVIWNGVST